ncbi:MAG: class I SAM-dependent rRNA methyltransferase [Chlamydiota bacterium]
MEKKVFLKKDKERFIKQNRHPWIFSGAIASFPEGFSSGDTASLYSHEGEFLATAYFNIDNSLSGRILSFEKRPIEEIIQEKIREAFSFRKSLFDRSETNCFRCVNAEEDGLPGLIVDFYDKIAVIQINTLGMDKLRSLVVDAIIKELSPLSIYEKSNSSSRLQEGLEKKEGLLYGETVFDVTVRENGILFSVSITEGQKTGFFLDQREMRKKIGELSKDKSVLNCCSYSGGFSLFALKGGAKEVTSVDSCLKAVELAVKNTELNDFSLDKHHIIREDVFTFLEEEDLSSYDLIILDPPAFAKKRADVEPACRGYKQLNQSIFERCKKNTLLLTCSCSYFIDDSLFKQVLFQAASAAKREVKILQTHIHALDHPISLYHPEGDYLKSFLLWIV